MSRFYITTAIDYVNSRPHLGTAYEKVTADVIARYKRLSGIETRFLMGNDEHSQNVYQRAKEEGLEPLEFCDRMEQASRDIWKQLDISFDDFIRTTEERHKAGVTKLVQKIADADDLYEGAYEGWYCISCEAFKQEKDLVNGDCPIHQKKPQWIKEKNHFFRLAKYKKPLIEHYASHPDFLRPDIRRNEILRFLESGLEDISISRTGQAWGIPLPFDSRSVVYVWVDALINYISAIGYGIDDKLFQTWWPASLHVIGKDITRFHCVIWPAMLMSAGLELPHQVFGHGWVHWQGQKMSKSLGTVLDPLEVANRLGPDPLRLYLTKEITYGQDGDFTWERFEERYNVDLANNFGNLVNRFTTMAHRYRQGSLVVPTGSVGPLAKKAHEVMSKYRVAMDSYALHQGVAVVFDLLDATNEFISTAEPWFVAKDTSRVSELDRILYEIGEAIRVASILLLPVMPSSCAEVLRRVGEYRQAKTLRLDDAIWSETVERKILKGDPLWPRLEIGRDRVKFMNENEIEVTLPSSSDKTAVDNKSKSSNEQISIDQFLAVDIRVGKVLEAEAVPKSRKLLKVRLDTGAEECQIVAGIAGSYEPDDLVGRTVVFVANLKPVKLAGVESNGMILAASGLDGRAVLLTVDNTEIVPAGSQVS